MPCIWGEFEDSQIFLSAALLPVSAAEAIKDGSHPDSSTNVSIFRALVDTGAQSTCISARAAGKLGIDPIGKVPVSGVSGIKYHNNYLFHIGFIFGDPGVDSEVSKQELYVLNKAIQGAEFEPGGSNFDILLGMDVIGSGTLNIAGNGNFSFCF